MLVVLSFWFSAKICLAANEINEPIVAKFMAYYVYTRVCVLVCVCYSINNASASVCTLTTIKPKKVFRFNLQFQRIHFCVYICDVYKSANFICYKTCSMYHLRVEVLCN